MMLAIDDFGEIYYSLMQANTNDTTMELFLFNLVKLLDKKLSTWRKEYIIMLDGAVWHTSKETIETLERLNIPSIIIGPYGYDVAPVELFFSALKRGNLNQNNIPLSKSKFILFSKILLEYL